MIIVVEAKHDDEEEDEGTFEVDDGGLGAVVGGV